MIYKLRYDREHFLVAYIMFDEVKAKLGDYFALDAETWSNFWRPLDIEFVDESDAYNVLTPPDITCWFTDNLILNERACKAIGESLIPYGEMLPASCEGIRYWALHVTKKTGMDAVDEQKSERAVDEGGFIDVRSLAFNGDKIGQLLLFKSEFDGYRNVFCTEAFKELVEKAGLRGLCFSTDLCSVV